MTDVIKTQTKQYGSGIQVSTKNEPGGPPLFLTVSAPPQGVMCQVLHGDNDPNWKIKLKRGDGVVTYLSGSDLKAEGNAFFAGRHVITNNVHSTKTTRQFWGDAYTLCDLPVAASGIAVTQADNTAKMAFIKKAIAAQQALQGLVVLGELRETLNLIRHPLEALRRSVDELTGVAWKRRRKFGKIYKDDRRDPRLRRLMADTYLEWAFGAQPLVSDILSGCEAASRIMTYHPPQRFVMGKGGTVNSSAPLKRTTSGSGLACEYTILRQTEAEVKYYGYVYTQMPFISGSNSGQLGIRLTDVIPAVWELIPYSFLVDYFTNAQEIVNAACFPTSSIRWAARGERVTSSNTLVAADCKYVGGLSFGDVITENTLSVGTGCKVSRQEMVRYSYDGGWVPRLEFQIPGLFDKKWLNVAALAATGARFNGTNRL